MTYTVKFYKGKQVVAEETTEAKNADLAIVLSTQKLMKKGVKVDSITSIEYIQK